MKTEASGAPKLAQGVRFTVDELPDLAAVEITGQTATVWCGK